MFLLLKGLQRGRKRHSEFVVVLMRRKEKNKFACGEYKEIQLKTKCGIGEVKQTEITHCRQSQGESPGLRI